jgi:hypothetical protein
MLTGGDICVGGVVQSREASFAPEAMRSWNDENEFSADVDSRESADYANLARKRQTIRASIVYRKRLTS